MNNGKYPPVHPEKINLVIAMIEDPVVGALYQKWVSLKQIFDLQSDANILERNQAFHEYCHARDLFLGLKKPVQIIPLIPMREEA